MFLDKIGTAKYYVVSKVPCRQQHGNVISDALALSLAILACPAELHSKQRYLP